MLPRGNERFEAKCPICGAMNQSCAAKTSVTFVRRNDARARWRSTRRVYRRMGRAFVLEYRMDDGLDIVEAVRQDLVSLQELTEPERRHFVEVAKRKAQRLGIRLREPSIVDGPVEDKQMKPSDIVRRVFAEFVDEDRVHGPRKQVVQK